MTNNTKQQAVPVAQTLTARDAQELVRKMYEAEGVDRTKVSLAVRHAVPALYAVSRVGNRYVAKRLSHPCKSGEGAGEALFPDIGPDPMRGDRADRIEQSIAVCRAAYVQQQKGVPDQTALVWRWHLGALIEYATRLKAMQERDAATGRAKEEGGNIVAWRERDGDEWAYYDADSDTGKHIVAHQRERHNVSIFPLFAALTPDATQTREAELVEQIERALKAVDKIDVQAKCLEGYAEQDGHSGKAPASIYHWQATHFRDLATEIRAALNARGGA